MDVLREALTDRGMEATQVDELIIKKTLGGPKRFRPKTREEMALELVEMTKQNEKLQKKVARAKVLLKNQASSIAEAGSGPSNPLTIPSSTGKKAAATEGLTVERPVVEAAPSSTLASLVSPQFEEEPGAITEGDRVSDLAEEVATLRAALAAKQRVLTDKLRENERLQAGEREARRAAERAEAQKHKYRELKDAYRDQHARLTLAMTEKESVSSQLRSKIEELRVVTETAEVRIQAKDEECLTRMGDLKDAIEREGELYQELEAERRMGASEKMRHRQEVQTKAEAERKTAKALEEATSERDRLRQKVEALEEKLTKAGGTEVELGVALNRLRDANAKNLSLDKDIKALRGRHEEAQKSETHWQSSYKAREENVQRLSEELTAAQDALTEKDQLLKAEKSAKAKAEQRVLEQEKKAKVCLYVRQVKSFRAFRPSIFHSPLIILPLFFYENNPKRQPNSTKTEFDSKLREEKEHAQGDLSRKEKDFAEQKARLEASLQSAEEEREQYRRDLEAKGQSAESALRTSQENAAAVARLQRKNEELQGQLATALSDAEELAAAAVEAREAHAAVEEEVGKTKSTAAAAVEAAAAAARLEAQEEARGRVAELEEKLAQAEAKVKDLEKQLAEQPQQQHRQPSPRPTATTLPPDAESPQQLVENRVPAASSLQAQQVAAEEKASHGGESSELSDLEGSDEVLFADTQPSPSAQNAEEGGAAAEAAASADAGAGAGAAEEEQQEQSAVGGATGTGIGGSQSSELSDLEGAEEEGEGLAASGGAEEPTTEAASAAEPTEQGGGEEAEGDDGENDDASSELSDLDDDLGGGVEAKNDDEEDVEDEEEEKDDALLGPPVAAEESSSISDTKGGAGNASALDLEGSSSLIQFEGSSSLSDVKPPPTDLEDSSDLSDLQSSKGSAAANAAAAAAPPLRPNSTPQQSPSNRDPLLSTATKESKGGDDGGDDGEGDHDDDHSSSLSDLDDDYLHESGSGGAGAGAAGELKKTP